MRRRATLDQKRVDEIAAGILDKGLHKRLPRAGRRSAFRAGVWRLPKRSARKPSQAFLSKRGNTSAWRQDIKTVSLLAAFLSVPFATSTAVEGIQIGQSAKSPGSSNKFHRPGTTEAAWWTRRFGLGPVMAFVTHDTVLARPSETRPPVILGASITHEWLED
jgi:hypothetical protein